jgi:hypothetical protein
VSERVNEREQQRERERVCVFEEENKMKSPVPNFFFGSKSEKKCGARKISVLSSAREIPSSFAQRNKQARSPLEICGFPVFSVRSLMYDRHMHR